MKELELANMVNNGYVNSQHLICKRNTINPTRTAPASNAYTPTAKKV